MVLIRKICLLVVLCGCVQLKTIRSKIYTNENGTKELVLSEDNSLKKQEIDFLLKNLNGLNITTKVRKVEEEADGKEQTELNEDILMKHWNSLTEVGWKDFHPIKKLFLNSTRILRLAPEFRQEDEAPGNETSSSDLCQSVIDVCQMQTNREDLVKCLTSKNETLLGLLEEKLGNISACLETGRNVSRETEEVSSRSLLRPRRLLQKVLLPLLVIMVIKYLVTLPFVAVSVFTLNAMWLGLLSLGAVLFAKFKGHDHYLHKYPHRRLHDIPGGEVYDMSPVHASEIIWSPIRVPITQSAIGHK